MVGHIPAGKHHEKMLRSVQKTIIGEFPILQYFLADLYTLNPVCRDIANSLP